MKRILALSTILGLLLSITALNAKRCCIPRCRGFGVPACPPPPLVSFGCYGPYYPPFNPMFFGPPVAPYPYYARPGVAFGFSVGL